MSNRDLGSSSKNVSANVDVTFVTRELCDNLIRNTRVHLRRDVEQLAYPSALPEVSNCLLILSPYFPLSSLQVFFRGIAGFRERRRHTSTVHLVESARGEKMKIDENRKRKLQNHSIMYIPEDNFKLLSHTSIRWDGPMYLGS